MKKVVYRNYKSHLKLLFNKVELVGNKAPIPILWPLIWWLATILRSMEKLVGKELESKSQRFSAFY